MSYEKLHERALECAKNFKRAEMELISILQEIDNKKAFRWLGYSSLFQYATSALKLAENQAYAFITVARKAKEVPELKHAISTGKINTSQARRITSVINSKNKTEWIEKASVLSQRELEKELVKVSPKEAVKEKMSYVASDRVELKCGISEKLMKEVERVKDLLSQKMKKPCSLEDALQAMTTLFIERNCPIKKAERNLKEPKLASRREHMATSQGRAVIPARVKHQVNQRDLGQCVRTTADGKRCEEKRWLQLHH